MVSPPLPLPLAGAARPPRGSVRASPREETRYASCSVLRRTSVLERSEMPRPQGPALPLGGSWFLPPQLGGSGAQACLGVGPGFWRGGGSLEKGEPLQRGVSRRQSWGKAGSTPEPATLYVAQPCGPAPPPGAPVAGGPSAFLSAPPRPSSSQGSRVLATGCCGRGPHPQPRTQPWDLAACRLPSPLGVSARGVFCTRQTPLSFLYRKSPHQGQAPAGGHGCSLITWPPRPGTGGDSPETGAHRVWCAARPDGLPGGRRQARPAGC